jgi:hypothetical protein
MTFISAIAISLPVAYLIYRRKRPDNLEYDPY